jgi:hypothetical protein
VFEAIHDPAVLLACIPGCETIEQVATAEYRARIAIRLPGIAGAWMLNVHVADAVAPAWCRLEGRLEGGPGTVSGRATIDLSDVSAGGSRLVYDADARIDGPLAWLDSALVERLARTILDQGLARLDQEIGRRAGSGAEEPGVAEAGVAT